MNIKFIDKRHYEISMPTSDALIMGDGEDWHLEIKAEGVSIRRTYRSFKAAFDRVCKWYMEGQ